MQLIAETVVELLNAGAGPAATPELMEKALDEAVISGQNVLYQLMQGESTLPGDWDYLTRFRHTDEQPEPDDEAIRRSLRRRQLVLQASAGGSWRLRAPLMARWLRLRA